MKIFQPHSSILYVQKDRRVIAYIGQHIEFEGPIKCEYIVIYLIFN
jgi:hypothetical protein